MNGDDIAVTLASLSCTDLSDAMDRLGLPCQCAAIMPLDRAFRLVGRAYTLRYALVGHEGGTVGDYIDDVAPGEVVVIDNGGRCDVTVWGDLLTSTAARRGVSGVVIDGVSRDVDRSVELGFPIFSRGTWMRTGKDRVMLEAAQRPVSIGGIAVAPGDWLRGDGDGLVVIPASEIESAIRIAMDIHAAEDNIRAAVERGMPLKQARAEFNYHRLQSRPS